MGKLDSVLAILVLNLKGTVTLTTNVKEASLADQTIVQVHLDLMHTQIAVILPLLELRIFAQLTNLVMQMKATVILMMNAKAICFVDQTTVLILLGLYLQMLQLTAVNQKVINQF